MNTWKLVMAAIAAAAISVLALLVVNALITRMDFSSPTVWAVGYMIALPLFGIFWSVIGKAPDGNAPKEANSLMAYLYIVSLPCVGAAVSLPAPAGFLVPLAMGIAFGAIWKFIR